MLDYKLIVTVRQFKLFLCAAAGLAIDLKIVNHWNDHDNGVMCTGKEIRSGLKLVRMETDNTYVQAPFRRKT